jgi:hypothetical protein
MVDCGAGSQFADCTCSGVAQKVQGTGGEFICCGNSNLNGFRFERRCREAGWTPTAKQQEIRDLWAQIAQEAVPIIFTRDGGLATIDCYRELPYPLEFVIGGQRERLCSPTHEDPYRLADYDPALKVYEIAGCDYPASGLDDRTESMVCGPKPDNSFFQGPLIPNPGSEPGNGGGGGGGGGDNGNDGDGDDGEGGTDPGSTPVVQTWWFWLLMAVIVLVIIGIIVYAVRKQQEKSEYDEDEGEEENKPLATEPRQFSYQELNMDDVDAGWRRLYDE